ncbi:MAG: ankyrin repeat domain-containing protein [Acidobacteria bacterium]|nr:ankyrin repeat domain-containing protein [Acidobacteriota bacterium]
MRIGLRLLVVIALATLAGCARSPEKPQRTEAEKQAYLEANVILTACSASDLAQVKALLEKKPALINAQDDTGATPLSRAVVAMRPNEELVRYLLEHGAEEQGASKWEETPLHGAAGRSSKKIVELLLEHGAKVNARSRYGRMPMSFAAWNNRTENADVLLAHGAEITVIEAAALGKEKKLEEFLRKDPKALNVKDKEGLAPLHWAARNGHIEAVRLLMKHGASAFEEGRTGMTPCYLAREFKHTEIVALMRCP